MIAAFEREIVAVAALALPDNEPAEIPELLAADVRAMCAGAAAQRVLTYFAAARHPMGYPVGAGAEETARLNGQREVVAFLIRWSESKIAAP